jgi:hypothetical protein
VQTVQRAITLHTLAPCEPALAGDQVTEFRCCGRPAHRFSSNGRDTPAGVGRGDQEKQPPDLPIHLGRACSGSGASPSAGGRTDVMSGDRLGSPGSPGRPLKGGDKCPVAPQLSPIHGTLLLFRRNRVWKLFSWILSSAPEDLQWAARLPPCFARWSVKVYLMSIALRFQ